MNSSDDFASFLSELRACVCVCSLQIIIKRKTAYALAGVCCSWSLINFCTSSQPNIFQTFSCLDLFNLFTAELQLPFKSFTNLEFSFFSLIYSTWENIFFISSLLFHSAQCLVINVITHDIVVKYELLKFIKNESNAESTKEFNWTTLLPSRNEKTYFSCVRLFWKEMPNIFHCHYFICQFLMRFFSRVYKL